MRRHLADWIVLLALAACGGSSSGKGKEGDAASVVPATFERYDAAAVSGGPGTGSRYAVGAVASDSVAIRTA